MKNALYLLLVVAATPAAARSDDRRTFDEWIGDKLRAAQKQLKKSDSSSFSANSVVDMEMSTGGPAVSFKTHELHKASGDNSLISSYTTDIRPAGEKPRATQFCAGTNSRYYFELGRNRRGDDWLLERVLEPEAAKDPSARTQIDMIKRESGPYFEMLTGCRFRAGLTQVSELAKLPGFVLRSAIPTSDNNAIDVAFSYTLALPNAPDENVSCTVRYDLNMYGLPTEMTEVSGEPSSLWAIEDSKKLVSFDGKTCVVETGRFQTGKKNNKIVYSTKARSKATVVLGRLPESEFTLTAFGLPEPPGFEPKPTPLYVWLLATAAVCLVLFALFRLLARRRAAA